jgi:hypothetical protein
VVVCTGWRERESCFAPPISERALICMLEKLAEFSGAEDWIFASPVKLGRLPYSYTGVWRELERASQAAETGHLGTHSGKRTARGWT